MCDKTAEDRAKAARNAEYLAKIGIAARQIAEGRGQVHELVEVDDEDLGPPDEKT